MKRYSMVAIMCLFVLSMVMPCSAGEFTDQMKAKLSRGVKNVFGSLGEIGKAMSEQMETDTNPVYGACNGIFQGSGKALVRAGSGLYDIVVAPVPHAKTFPPQPETLFNSTTEKTVQATKK
jgi:putative exosortase-associated protein (TIGR04073 family)